MVDVKGFLLNSNYHNLGLYNMQEPVRNGAVDVKEEWVSELVTLHKRKFKKNDIILWVWDRYGRYEESWIFTNDTLWNRDKFDNIKEIKYEDIQVVDYITGWSSNEDLIKLVVKTKRAEYDWTMYGEAKIWYNFLADLKDYIDEVKEKEKSAEFFCKNCGTKYEPGQKFCGECGVKLQ